MATKAKAKRPVIKRAAKAAVPSESFWWRIVGALPFLIVAGFVAFASVAMILLLLGQLRSILVFPLGLAAAAVAGWFVFQHATVELPGSVKERHVFGALAILFVFLWIGFNSHYSAQDVFVFQDPGFYTVAGEYLKNHDNLVLHTPTVFGSDPAIKADTAGFEMLPTSPGRLFVQAPHLLPIMLGLAARIGGTAFMLHFNAVFGGLALLAVYGLARCFMRPRWAFMAMAVLAACLPMIYFSRDTYSEPMDMLLIMGSLALLWLAQKKSNKWLWLLAGLAGGAATMSRIDAYLVVAALLAAVIVMLLVAKKEERPALARHGIYYLVGITVTSLLGWLDVSHLSAQYYNALVHQFKHEVLFIVLLVVAGVVAIYVSWTHEGLLQWLDKKTVKWRAKAAVLVVVAAALFFATRSLWFVGYGPTNPIIFALQKSEGLTVAHRTYAEQTVKWIVWYIGPVLTLLGVVGIAGIAYRLVQRRRYLVFLPFLVVLGITMVVYLYSPNITPYQIWAARRFLPIVFPGLAITAALVLDRFDKRNLLQGMAKKGALLFTILVIFAAPLYISKPFLRVRIYVPELAEVDDICSALPAHAAVLVMGVDGLHMTEPISAFCGVPTMRVGIATVPCKSTICPTVQLPTTDLASAAQAAIRQGYDPVTVAVSGDGDDYSQPLINEMTQLTGNTYEQYAMSIKSPPRIPVVYSRTIFVAQLHADGSISPLSVSKNSHQT